MKSDNGVRMNRRVFVWVLILAGILVALPIPAFAQATQGRISGAITDQTGGAMAGTAVTVKDMQRGTLRTLTTDESGLYVAPNLLPGTYSVRAEAPGFQSIERLGVLLEVGQDIHVDLILRAGEQTQTVTVTGEAPSVDVSNATLGGTLSNETINDLPLIGRNFQNLAQLRPGVTSYAGGGSLTQSTNGLRPEDTIYVVEGLDNTSPLDDYTVINNAGLLGDAANLLPIDAIQEFNTEENPKAEFGWRPGAVVNVGIKSGTNGLHGTAYAFGRSDAFDARNYFNQVGTPKTPVELEQWGTTVGGPIVKDKLFFFGAYESQHYSVGNAFVLQLPTTASGAGVRSSVPDAEAALVAKSIAVSPLSLSLLKYWGPNNGPTASVVSTLPNSGDSKNAVAKIDYHINAHNVVSGMYYLGNSNITGESAGLTQEAFLDALFTRSQVALGSWTWVPNSRWVNEVRFGYNRLNRVFNTVDSNVLPAAYGLNTSAEVGGFPNITVSGLTQLGGNKNFPKLTPDQQYDFVEQVSYLRGNHAFKFGGEILRPLVMLIPGSNARGQISFSGGLAFSGSSGLEDFLAGLPTSGTLLVGRSPRNFRQWQYATFVQDDWRVKRNVTVNLGLRYEYATPITETNNLLGNFVPGVGLVQVGQQIGSAYNGDHLNFSPRLGVAWDVSGKGTTIIRAGGSIIYDQLPIGAFVKQEGSKNTQTLGLGTNPTGASYVVGGSTTQGSGSIAVATISFPSTNLNWNGSSVNGASIFGSGEVQCGDSLGADPPPCSILAVNRNLRTPYVSTWTATIQHAFANNLSMEIAYVGNHGADLASITDINQPAIGSGWTAAAITKGKANQAAELAARPFHSQFPYLGIINYVSNLDRSNYNGLQATLTGRSYHGLSFIAAYTYAHALDNNSRDLNQNGHANSLSPGLDYGPTDFDLRHRLTLTTTYSIPGRKSPLQLLQGWQLNSLVTVQSGLPWGAMDSSHDISGTAEKLDRWDFFGNPSDFKPGRATGIPFFSGATNPACAAKALALDGGTAGLTSRSLALFGCYGENNSIMIPPAVGTFGTMRRNIFRDTGFRGWDLSVVKNWQIGERLKAQFRAEAFNILNHPNFANPWGGPSNYGSGATADPSQAGTFGCSCATPDVASGNPVLGSGGNRAMQFGLKLIF